MSPIIGIMVVFLGYLLGSIPSAHIAGRLKGIDLTMENGDGRLGTSLTFHRLGKISGVLVAIMDFTKGIMTIVVAHMADVPPALVLLAGFAAVVGHDWSIFLNFKGGRGTMVSYGVLALLSLGGLVISGILAGIFFLFTRRSTLATVILMTILVILLWIQRSFHFPPAMPWEREITPWLIIFPLTLLIPSSLKYVQTRERRINKHPVKG